MFGRLESTHPTRLPACLPMLQGLSMGAWSRPRWRCCTAHSSARSSLLRPAPVESQPPPPHGDRHSHSGVAECDSPAAAGISYPLQYPEVLAAACRQVQEFPSRPAHPANATTTACQDAAIFNYVGIGSHAAAQRKPPVAMGCLGREFFIKPGEVSHAPTYRCDATPRLQLTVDGVADLLPQVANLMLLICGLDDIVVPFHNVVVMAGAVPTPWLVVYYPHSGHGAHFQNQQSALDIISNFLRLPQESL